MAQQTINLGTTPDDGTGDTIRAGGTKINSNFTELYTNMVLPNEVYQSLSTGVIAGGAISINGGDNTLFDVTETVALFVDHTASPPTVSIEVFPAQTGVAVTDLATEASTDLAYNSSGTLLQARSFTDSQKRSLVVLGGLDHSDNSSISRAFSIQTPPYAPTLSLQDFARAVGDINRTGNVFGAASTDLTIQKSTGTVFSFGRNAATDKTNPHVITQASQNPVTFTYIKKNGTGGTTFTPGQTNINPSQYDNEGTLDSVGGTNWTIQRILMFANSGSVFVQYGETTYTKKADALSALSPSAFTSLPGLGTALVRGYLIVKNGTTNLSNTSDAEFREADKFGSAGGSASSITDLQGAYDNSSTPEIVVDATRGALTVQDSATPLGAPLFEVQSNGGGTTYFGVSTIGSNVNLLGIGGAPNANYGLLSYTLPLAVIRTANDTSETNTYTMARGSGAGRLGHIYTKGGGANDVAAVGIKLGATPVVTWEATQSTFGNAIHALGSSFGTAGTTPSGGIYTDIGYSSGSGKGYVQTYNRTGSSFVTLTVNNVMDVTTSGVDVTGAISATGAFNQTAQGIDSYHYVNRTGTTTVQTKFYQVDATGITTSRGTSTGTYAHVTDTGNYDCWLSTTNSGGSGGKIVLDADTIEAKGFLDAVSNGALPAARVTNQDTINGFGLKINAGGSAAGRYALTVNNVGDTESFVRVSTETGKVGRLEALKGADVTGAITATTGVTVASGQNTLANYLEGTYTATLTCSTSGTVTLNSSLDTLSYTRIGNRCYVSGYIEVSSVSSPTGELRLNLPFTVADFAELGERAAFPVFVSNSVSKNANQFALIFVTGVSYVHFFSTDSNVIGTTLAGQMKAGTEITISFWYPVA